MRTTDSHAGPGSRLPLRRASLSATSPRSRMLAALALVGAAALTVGCASQLAAPGAPTPSESTARAIGAEPVPIETTQLEAMGFFEEVSERGYAVRWAADPETGEYGESIVVVLGGSGGGGSCIPQPQAALLDGGSAPSIVVPFDPIDPEMMCTMDFRLHGWELALPEALDIEATVPVTLVGMQGEDAETELELTASDLFVPGGGADPQPSEVDEAPQAAVPATPFDAARLPQAQSVVEGATALDVWWIEPGSSIAVVMSGSGTEACVPQPVGAAAAGPGAIEVAFAPAVGDTCTDDLVAYGWQLDLPSAISATLPVQVTVTGTSDAGPAVERTLEPGDVLELP
ncbi:hypothetical protein [Agrococcus sp. Marseille-P2731]|uniref:hypothetical protein n=1 Tax=Agrococcus sp. Marseille-P2731 TaxID=1841862 RepID=UPI000930EF04|nr:hypothetical protein [Agrococcus sp. Marseille-P2731]